MSTTGDLLIQVYMSEPESDLESEENEDEELTEPQIHEIGQLEVYNHSKY